MQILWGVIRTFLLMLVFFGAALFLQNVSTLYATVCFIGGVFFMGVFCLMVGRVIADDWDD